MERKYLTINKQNHRLLKQYCLDHSLSLSKCSNAIIKNFLDSEGYKLEQFNLNKKSSVNIA